MGCGGSKEAKDPRTSGDSDPGMVPRPILGVTRLFFVRPKKTPPKIVKPEEVKLDPDLRPKPILRPSTEGSAAPEPKTSSKDFVDIFDGFDFEFEYYDFDDEMEPYLEMEGDLFDEMEGDFAETTYDFDDEMEPDLEMDGTLTLTETRTSARAAT